MAALVMRSLVLFPFLFIFSALSFYIQQRATFTYRTTHLPNLSASLANKLDELLLLNRTSSDFSRSATLCFTKTQLGEHILDPLFIVLGDFNRASLSKELPKYRQYVLFNQGQKHIGLLLRHTEIRLLLCLLGCFGALWSLCGSSSPDLQAELKMDLRT